MRLPSFKSIERQSFLWDDAIGNHGHARTVLGDFAEDLTAKLLRGRRYKTDCRAEYCPDIGALDAYFECKTAGRSNQTFVYEGRLEKDRRFASEHPLFYVVWHHSANTLVAASSRDLQRLFLATLKQILVVPFGGIDQLAGKFGKTPLNSKYGHSDTNPIYGAGYRIPVSALLTVEHMTIAIEHQPQRELF